MTPTERMARAICIAHGESPEAVWRWVDNTGKITLPMWRRYETDARAAYHAALGTIREPTPAMLAAAVAAYDANDPNGPVWADIWRTMVDCALAETAP